MLIRGELLTAILMMLVIACSGTPPAVASATPTSSASAVAVAPSVTATPGAAAPCATEVFRSGPGALPIPDLGAIDPGISVQAKGVVQTVEVAVNVIHPFDSDLTIELLSPESQVVTLAQADGLWGHDFTDTVFTDAAPISIVSGLPPFSGRFRPVQALTALTGTAAQGMWKLRVSGSRGAHAGRLEDWSLTLTSCGTVRRGDQLVGAPTPPPLPAGVPSGALPDQGTVLTVTTVSDAVNGDVSSVAGLQKAPGPDGISLREAILATNNEAGTVTIRFAPALAGSTIRVGSATGVPLPPLTGGGTLIDGDINGDGLPDVTLDGQRITTPSRCGICGLAISSSGNRVHALAFQQLDRGVFFAPPRGNTDPTVPSGGTFSGNTISGSVFTDIREAGIALWPTLGYAECEQVACPTRDQWLDTRIVGNTIRSRRDGVEIVLRGSVGDVVRRTTIAGNKITMGGRSFGVDFVVGDGGGANGNAVLDAIVAYNAIDASAPGGVLTEAITVTVGRRGGQSNRLETMSLIGNRVQFAPGALRARAIVLGIADGCSVEGVLVSSGKCSTGNVIKGVDILRNALNGQTAGVMIDPCCGTATQSTISDVHIAENLVDGIVPASDLNPWGIEVAGPATFRVTIDHNTISQRTTDVGQAHIATLAGAGIAVLGGLGSDHKEVHDVAVTSNRIDTELLGITVVGGGPSDEPAAFTAESNRVADVRLAGNEIERRPDLALHWDPNVKGITVIGGLGGTAPDSEQSNRATRNVVDTVTLAGNAVAGEVDDFAVYADLGASASQNTARNVTKSAR